MHIFKGEEHTELYYNIKHSKTFIRFFIVRLIIFAEVNNSFIRKFVIIDSLEGMVSTKGNSAGIHDVQGSTCSQGSQRSLYSIKQLLLASTIEIVTK